MKSTCVLFLFFFGMNCFSVEKIILTENSISDLVKSGNKLVTSRQKITESKFESTGSLRRSFIPKVNIEIGQESFKYISDDYKTSPYYKTGLEINLINAGKDLTQEKVNKIDVKMAQASQKIAIQEQIEEARKTFWNALYLKFLIGQLNDGAGWIDKNKTAALKRIRAGVATNSDKFEFEIKQVEIHQDILRARLSLEKHIEHLKSLLGVEQSTVLELGQKLNHDHNWKTLLRHSEEEHDYILEPDKLQIEKSKLQAQLASRKWLPKVDGYAYWLQNSLRKDIDRSISSDRQQTVYGLRATWTITDYFSGNAQKQSANAMTQSYSYGLQYKQRHLENELHLELKELELLDKMVHDADENIKRSNHFFNLISKEYNRGVKSSGDMLMATEKLLESKVRKMSMIRDFQIAKAHVMKKLID